MQIPHTGLTAQSFSWINQLAQAGRGIQSMRLLVDHFSIQDPDRLEAFRGHVVQWDRCGGRSRQIEVRRRILEELGETDDATRLESGLSLYLHLMRENWDASVAKGCFRSLEAFSAKHSREAGHAAMDTAELLLTGKKSRSFWTESFLEKIRRFSESADQETSDAILSAFYCVLSTLMVSWVNHYEERGTGIEMKRACLALQFTREAPYKAIQWARFCLVNALTRQSQGHEGMIRELPETERDLLCQARELRISRLTQFQRRGDPLSHLRAVVETRLNKTPDGRPLMVIFMCQEDEEGVMRGEYSSFENDFPGFRVLFYLTPDRPNFLANFEESFSGQEVSVFVVNSHGNSKRFALSEKADGRFGTSSVALLRPHAAKIKREGHVILDSCSAGKALVGGADPEENLAIAFSKTFDCFVHAIEEDGVNRFHIQKTPDATELVFDSPFHVVYRNGARVEARDRYRL